MILLNTPQTLKAFNGKSIKYKQIIYIALIDCLSFDMHKKCNFYLYVSHLYHYSIILDYPWL